MWCVYLLQVDMSKSEWIRNAAGLYHSHQHGFGELKAWRMVNTAKVKAEHRSTYFDSFIYLYMHICIAPLSNYV